MAPERGWCEQRPLTLSKQNRDEKCKEGKKKVDCEMKRYCPPLLGKRQSGLGNRSVQETRKVREGVSSDRWRGRTVEDIQIPALR